MTFDIEGQHDKAQQQFRSRVILGAPERPKMLDLILKTGIVKNEKTAANVLLFAAGFIFLLSLYLFSKSFRNTNTTPPPVLEIDKRMMQ